MLFTILQLAIRHAFTAIGLTLVKEGYVTVEDSEVFIGAIMTMFGIIWSILDKIIRGK